VHRPQPEAGAHGLELGGEPRRRPERVVVGPVGAPAPELVVEDDREIVAGEPGQHEEVLVVGAGPSVERDHGLLAGAEPAVEDLVSGVVDGKPPLLHGGSVPAGKNWFAAVGRFEHTGFGRYGPRSRSRS
jgi:hypothetical protein